MGLLFFLSSGLFLGWSLGANDAANVFGTAVGTRMVKFRTAAVVCSAFIIVGAVVSGSGAAHTLGRLGAVDALAGAFTVALAAALTTAVMTRLRIPVSTSQAIVGAIIGWNFYTDAVTDTDSLTQIVTTWIACPLLSGAIAVAMLSVLRLSVRHLKPHLLVMDAWTRYGLLVVGAFGSYSLGANNIANVMGVFASDTPFRDLQLGQVTITGVQQLFALGGVAIGVGVFTYSRRVMSTVGSGLLRLSPGAALVVVLSHSVTLFLFASERLEQALASQGLPTFPLVPVSSSQAVIGAIIGIGLVKGGKGIRYGVLGEISLGWAATPLLAGLTAFLLLFFVENVFDQKVNQDVTYRVDAEVIAELTSRGITDPGLMSLDQRVRTNAVRLKADLERETELDDEAITTAVDLARVDHLYVDPGKIAGEIDRDWFSAEQLRALRELAGRHYERSWSFRRDLAAATPEWRPLPDEVVNRAYNKERERKLAYLVRILRLREGEEPMAGSVTAPVDRSGGVTTPR